MTLWTLGPADRRRPAPVPQGWHAAERPPADVGDRRHPVRHRQPGARALAGGRAWPWRSGSRTEPGRVYCLTSDGEWNEGSCWEALIFARHHRLDNLTILVDLNGLQGFGTTREVADLDPLAEKFRAFGVPTAGDRRTRSRGDPAGDRDGIATGLSAVVARTRKGCGVSFMEDRMEWHYLPLDGTPVPPGHPGDRASMRNAFCQTLVEAVEPPRVRVPDGRPGLTRRSNRCATRWATGSSTPAWPSRTWSRSRPAWRGRACGPGSTASRRSSTPGRSSRSATTSACTACRSCWSATAAATATA